MQWKNLDSCILSGISRLLQERHQCSAPSSIQPRRVLIFQSIHLRTRSSEVNIFRGLCVWCTSFGCQDDISGNNLHVSVSECGEGQACRIVCLLQGLFIWRGYHKGPNVGIMCQNFQESPVRTGHVVPHFLVCTIPG